MERRERVKITAARLLSLRPAATMEEIAAAAEVGRATVFRMFPSRAALVAELAQDAASLYVKAVEEARPEQGPAPDALRRVIAQLCELVPHTALLALQPLPEVVESDLLADISSTDQRVRAVVLRGQRDGVFRVDLTADWVLLCVTWLLVGAADGLRLGVLAPADVTRMATETLLAAVARTES